MQLAQVYLRISQYPENSYHDLSSGFPKVNPSLPTMIFFKSFCFKRERILAIQTTVAWSMRLERVISRTRE